MYLFGICLLNNCLDMNVIHKNYFPVKDIFSNAIEDWVQIEKRAWMCYSLIRIIERLKGLNMCKSASQCCEYVYPLIKVLVHMRNKHWIEQNLTLQNLKFLASKPDPITMFSLCFEHLFSTMVLGSGAGLQKID